MFARIASITGALALSWMVVAPTLADRSPETNVEKGVLYGKVIDTTNGQPIAGATVALRDRSDTVIAWTQTDAQGQYALATDALKALQLRPSRHRGLLAGLVHGVGQVVTAPVKVTEAAVGGAAKAVTVDPLNTAKSAAVSAVVANPGPLASEIAGSTARAFTDKATRKARENAVKTVLGERQATPKKRRGKLAPGEVFLAVTAPHYQELQCKAGAYWLEPAATDGGKPIGAKAWLETAKLAPAGSEQKSEIEDVAVLLADARMEPSLAPPGTPVKLRVKLQAPSEETHKVRVFAREDRKRQVVELKPLDDSQFAGELILDPKLSPGDTTITVVALREQPVEVDLRESKGDPLLRFAERLDDLDPDKAYEFDPRIMASENRLDLKLTVLDRKKAAPAPPAPQPGK
jgi:carboxypeptidase family protein